MESIINGVFTILVLLGGLWFAYASSLYVARKKQLQREGKLDYHGNPIEQEPEKPNWNINEGV